MPQNILSHYITHYIFLTNINGISQLYLLQNDSILGEYISITFKFIVKNTKIVYLGVWLSVNYLTLAEFNTGQVKALCSI